MKRKNNMISFIQVYETEKILDEETKKIHLENIEHSVFRGVDAIKEAAGLLNDQEINKLFRSISIRTMNEVAHNNVYNHQITSKITIGKAISDTAALVKHIALSAEADLNKKIESSKRTDTRTKRIKEKTIVLNWYRANKDEVKKLFDLYNLFVEAKKKKNPQS